MQSVGAKFYVEVRIKKEHFRALAEGHEITSMPIQSMIDRALEQYIECDLSAMIEERAKVTATA